jgi:hypothetical protein
MNELLVGASARQVVRPADGKSQSTFERVTINCTRYFLKRLSPASDWIMRVTGGHIRRWTPARWIIVDEVAVEVGVTEAEQLVNYRFGQAHFADWLARIGAAAAEEIRRHAIEAVRPAMRPYRPIVVFLAASTPA